MSLDKSGKNSGSRRKARECALQMLFAADLVGGDVFSTSTYWAELGFDEVQKGAGTLALDIRDEIEKLSSEAEAIRGWIKKADPTESTGKRSDWTKAFSTSVDGLKAAFLSEASELSSGGIPTDERTASEAERAVKEFKTLVSGLETKVLPHAPTLQSEEKTHFAELRSHGHNALRRLKEELLPAFAKLVTSTAATRPFANKLVDGALSNIDVIDERIRTRAEHWRIERMAIVDRNVLRLAVYEFLFEDTPHTVVINEALEIARRFSTFEATQFINGILDAIKLDLEKNTVSNAALTKERSQSSSS